MCWSEPQMLVETTLRIAPWLHLRFCRSETTGDDVLSSSSFGNSIDWTSTSPGAMKTTPRFDLAVAAVCSERSETGLPIGPLAHVLQPQPGTWTMFEIERLVVQHAHAREAKERDGALREMDVSMMEVLIVVRVQSGPVCRIKDGRCECEDE